MYGDSIVGALIWRWRQRESVSQRDLAVMLRIGRNHLDRIEQGRTMPGDDLRNRFRDVLEIDPDVWRRQEVMAASTPELSVEEILERMTAECLFRGVDRWYEVLGRPGTFIVFERRVNRLLEAGELVRSRGFVASRQWYERFRRSPAGRVVVEVPVRERRAS